jgi:hypothetical protein
MSRTVRGRSFDLKKVVLVLVLDCGAGATAEGQADW